MGRSRAEAGENWLRVKRTAGPSTTLRSGRDDNSVCRVKYLSLKLCGYNRIVIPTGAKRSGGICCSFHTPPEALVDLDEICYFFPVTRRTPPPRMATTPRIGGNGTVLVSFLEAWMGPRSTTFFWCVYVNPP